ncbi:putative membrane protein (plasmid) [Sinorhizobium meliloti Rm41]|nr:putative membrane protein [Sinorhizobium meliloti Rm41]
MCGLSRGSRSIQYRFRAELGASTRNIVISTIPFLRKTISRILAPQARVGNIANDIVQVGRGADRALCGSEQSSGASMFRTPAANCRHHRSCPGDEHIGFTIFRPTCFGATMFVKGCNFTDDKAEQRRVLSKPSPFIGKGPPMLTHRRIVSVCALGVSFLLVLPLVSITVFDGSSDKAFADSRDVGHKKGDKGKQDSGG